MITVSIVGVGRIGGALALSLPKDSYKIDQLIGRTSAPNPGIQLDDNISFHPIRTLLEVDQIESDIVFITTRDAEIGPAAKDLVEKVRSSTIVFHTSGALSSAVLSDLHEIGCRTGSIHPLVSISEAGLGPMRFPGSFFCVEGENEAVSMGYRIVEDLGGQPFTIDTNFKTLYHASAVMACGHLVALFDAAVESMGKCGLEPDAAKGILLPLVLSTVRNLSEQSTEEALTGTFARADIETFTRHVTALNENVSDELLEIYLLLGERSLELASRQGENKDRIEKMRTKVAIAKSKLKW